MPTYEYHCTKCGHEFEVFHSITADPIRVCPKCSAKRVERKIGMGGAILFKGGGFYETDYRSESYTKAAEAERQGSKPAEATAAAGDAKPAANDGKAGSGKAGSAPASRETKGASSGPATPASNGAPPPKPDLKPDPKPEPSKATHPSRVGRGAGNIVQNPPKPKSPSKPSGTRSGSKPTKRGR